MTAAHAAVRAFLAVHLDPEVHAALAGLRAELTSIPSDVRWVRSENLHVTLKFLGSVPLAQLESIRASLTPVAAQQGACEVHVRGTGVFPTPKRPRVVWVGLESPGLAPLARAIETAVEPLGFAREERPFRAHLTLGRINGMSGWKQIKQALSAHADDNFGVCTIDEIVAYRSDLRSDGAVYTKLWSLLLEAGRGGVSPWQ